MKNYDHKKIENKWQKDWEKNKIYEAKNNSNKKKFYGLIEFPYPSGAGLHVGHVRSNTAMDIISRKRRMEGYSVLYPIGWDAFGLPTENYAIKTGIAPAKVTKTNTDIFRKQLKNIGFSFDWSREINTTNPTYYKWTQWIFLQMFKKGLAYKQKSTINWCTSCKIGLANEEVVGGVCERCGGKVIKKEKDQWMLAITKYADRLDKDLDDVDYLEKIKIQQRNWIGKSEGSEIRFKIKVERLKEENSNLKSANLNLPTDLEIFTTRADTIFGATYVVLAPEHELIKNLKLRIKNWDEVEGYINKIKNETDIERTADDKEKTGIELKGIKAINPANNEEISIWVADYVLVQYGTGAVMAVPAHDERDWDFAKKYNLPIMEVVEPLYKKINDKDGVRSGMPFEKRHAVVAVIKHWSEDKYLCLKWKKTDWRGFVIGGIENNEDIKTAAEREVIEETGYTSLKFIKEIKGIVHAQFYHAVKDVNRWAHFHPVLFELKNGNHQETLQEEKDIHDVVWISREEVELYLSWVEDMKLIWRRTFNSEASVQDGILVNSGKFNGLSSEEARKEITKNVGGKIVTKYKLRDWVFSRQRYWGEPIPLINCKKCGWVAVPEKDLPIVLPKVKSYQPTDNGESPLSNIKSWVNVKCPKCKGPAERETDTMPNWAGSSWYYLRYTDPKNKKELAGKKLLKYWTPVDWYNGGMEHVTLHLLYSRFWHKFLYDLKIVPTKEPYQKRTSHGMILAEDGEKMSKSRGNVINPDQIIKLYGADTLRVYEMFIGPFDQTAVWNTNSIIGSRRFLERVWNIGMRQVSNEKKTNIELEKSLHKTIKKVSEDIESMSFNTAISSMMVLVNEMEKSEISKNDFKKFLQILSPFAPHITEELWEIFGEKKSINKSDWPKWDKKKIIDDTVKIAVQVNGRVRAEIMIPKDMKEEEVKAIALKDKNIIIWVGDKEIKRFVYVPNRIVNIVV